MAMRMPSAVTAGLDAAPAALRERDQWVCWRREMRDGKPTKVPYRANDPSTKASSTDPATWASFEDARDVASGRNFDGAGFVLTEGDRITGIDLDDCISEGGELHPSAAEIVSRLDSYSERSPSGRGVRVFVEGELNGSRNRTRKTPWGSNIEAYDRRRFLTVTGDRLGGAPATIEDRQGPLDALVVEFLPDAVPSLNGPPEAGALDLSDDELLQRAFDARNGAKTKALYEGDISAYPSRSEADLALCTRVAFFAGPDPGRIDRLFRGSGLMRPKWDVRRGEMTYGARTIAKALAGRTDFYGRATPGVTEPMSASETRMEAQAPVRDEDGNAIDGDLLHFVCGKTGLRIKRVLHCGDGTYDLELETRAGLQRVPIGDSGGLYNPRAFEKAISNRCTGVAVSTYYAPKRWRPIATALIQIAEVQDTGSTEAEETKAWIASYVETFGAEQIDVNDAAALLTALRTTDEATPLLDRTGRLYLPVTALLQHVARNIGQRTSLPDLSQRLARLGFQKHRLQPKHDGETQRRRTLRSEPGFEVGPW